MKQYAKILFYIFCPVISFAQTCPDSICVSSNNIGQYQLHLNVSQTYDEAFWILGDGHFRMGSAISHQLAQAGSSLEVYLLKKYKPDPPPKLVCTNCYGNGISTPQQLNPQLFMGSGQYLKAGTSWNPRRGQSHFTILSFENSGNVQDGRIEFIFHNNIQNIQVHPQHNNNLWTSNLSIVNDTIHFEFSDLNIGEQRHVLIETVVDQYPVGQKLNYTSIMYDPLDNVVATYNSASYIKKFPHDPNLKLVNKKEICAFQPALELNYIITFQNEGDFFATDVFIQDQLPPELDLSSLQLISSSHTPEIIRHYATNEVEFNFQGINLPGLQQTNPYLYHYDETSGYVRFSIKTDSCLNPGIIRNDASIVFDQLDAIVTPLAITTVSNSGECYTLNDFCTSTEDIDFLEWSTQNNQEISLHLFPNPTSEYLWIEIPSNFDLNSIMQFAIFNSQGQRVLNLLTESTLSNDPSSIKLNVSDWPKGIYFAQIQNEKNMQTWKFIKQ